MKLNPQVLLHFFHHFALLSSHYRLVFCFFFQSVIYSSLLVIRNIYGSEGMVRITQEFGPMRGENPLYR